MTTRDDWHFKEASAARHCLPNVDVYMRPAHMRPAHKTPAVIDYDDMETPG